MTEPEVDLHVVDETVNRHPLTCKRTHNDEHQADE